MDGQTRAIPAPFPHPYADGFAIDVGGGLWIWDEAEQRWEIVEGGGPGSFEPIIAFGTVSEYWRGDKQWTLLDKVAVGLANVDNTSNSAKPISNATQTALNTKAPKATVSSSPPSGGSDGDVWYQTL